MNGIAKKVAATLAAALILVLWLPSISAFGAGPAASITIHKLETDPSRELSRVQDGDRITPPKDYEVYEGDNRISLGDLKGINGISFTVTRVQDYLEIIEDAEPYKGEGEYQKTLVTQNRGGERGIAVFENLPYGTYLIEEEPSFDYDGDTMKFLVQVPMTSPQGDRLIHDIHIYPKNTKRSSLRKEVAEFSPFAPGKVTWRFSWEIPVGIDNTQELVLTDQLDDRLTLSLSTSAVAVTCSNRSGSTRALNKQYYQVDYDKEENTVTVTINDSSAFDELAKVYLPDRGKKPPTLYIEITTNITADIKGVIYNTGYLDYKDSAGRLLGLIPERDPSIYIGDTGGLLIYKHDGDTGEPLSGAEFQLFPSKEDALAETNPIQNPRVGDGTWPATGRDGYTLLEGIVYEDAGTSYWLVETAAPIVAGSDPPLHYNLLPEPVEVTVNASSHLKENRVEVENKMGLTIGDTLTTARVPDGGGGGSLPWRVGGLLLLTAGMLLAAYRCKFRNSR